MPFLEVKQLRKSFGELPVLREVSFDVEQGDVIAIIGSSGSGKSTLLRCVNLLETPDAGEILVHGQDILRGRMDVNQYRARVGMVFQSFNLFGNMDVLKNCVVGQTHVLRRDKEEARQKALYFLEKVGMKDFLSAAPDQLSGGQKQRVAIAGIIAMRPRCIVLDEPTAMLDPRGRAEVLKTLRQLNQEHGITIALITHYMDEAAQCDRVVVVDRGRLLMDGKPREVFSRVEELKAVGLDVPQVTELMHRLRQAGLPVREDIITEEECAAQLEQLLA